MIKVFLKTQNKNGQTAFILRPTPPTASELKEVFDWPSREVYTTILNLTKEEDVSGQVVGTGSISVNGNSALRRTFSGLTLQTSDSALAQDYNWVMTDEIRIFQGISNEKTNNEIWYFNLGTYVLSSFSAAESLQGTKINISAKDKMVLLNGEQGGTFTVDTELSTGTSDSIPLQDLVKNVVLLAGIDFDKIHVNIEDTTGKELLEYRGSDPLYLFGEVNLNEEKEIEEKIIDFTVLGDSEVYFSSNKIDEISNLSWGATLTNGGGNNNTQPEYSNYVNKIYGPSRTGYNQSKYVARVLNGQVAGYKIVPLTYPGELKVSAGETVVTVLDKVVNVLGKEYEYFFDVDGEFYFQKKKALLSMTRATGENKNIILEDKVEHIGQDGSYSICSWGSGWKISNENFPFVKNKKYKITLTGTMTDTTKEDSHIGAFFVYKNSENSWLKSAGELILRRNPGKEVTNSLIFTYNPPENCTEVYISAYYRKPSGDGIPEGGKTSGCKINYLLVEQDENVNGYSFDFSHSEKDDTKTAYIFENKQLLTNLNRQPKLENIKNDFTIWGQRPSGSGKDGIPIHARYIVDEPFKYYINWRGNIEKDNEKGFWKWKDGINKEVGTSIDSDIICEELYQMSQYRGEKKEEYILIPDGKDYYKQFFPDIRYYWRQIFNPEEEGQFYNTDPTITEGSMKPTHWLGNEIPFGYENDYDNIYVNINDENTYTSLADTIDLSILEDVYDANGISLYNKTGYENRSIIYLDGEKIKSFYDYITAYMQQNQEDGLAWSEVRINFLKSLYYRENGRTNYLPLYEQVPQSLAKPHFADEIWNNRLSILYYIAPNEQICLVRSIELNNGNRYCASQSNLPAGASSNEKLSTILNGKIIKYQLYAGNWETVDNNGQFVLLQPKYDVMQLTGMTPTFNLSNYQNYSFFIKSTDGEDIYTSWIEKSNAEKNTWRFVVGYDKESGFLLKAPLDTITYKKTELYSNNDGTGLLSPSETGIKQIYFYPSNSTADKILIEDINQVSFIYLPCDWTGQLKSTGVVSQTKYQPVFVEQWEFNGATNKKLTYEQDPALLPFELVWITPKTSDELNNCKVSTIGHRALVKSEKAVTALNYSTIPPLYFTTSADEGLEMNEATERLFVLSSQGTSAADYIKSLLFEHAYCNETASTNIIPIYYLEPNNYIDITENGKTYHYILSQFSIPLSYNGTMSLTLTRDKLSGLE